MKWLRRFRFGTRLALLLATFSIGFLSYGAWSLYVAQKLSVGGPLYQRIEVSQQLVSDVLPPPEYIVESYMTCLQLTVVADTYRMGQLIERLRRLEQEYAERHDYWLRAQLTPELSDVLLRQAHAPAQAFFALVNHTFLPALFRNDKVAAARAGRTDPTLRSAPPAD